MKKILMAMCFIATTLSHAQTAKGGEDFTLGADISWYSQMTDQGYTFKYGAKNVSCPDLLTRYGMSAARFRVWVNPKDAYNGKDDVVRKAVEAHKAGLDILIDFHFSDVWADPAHQALPAAWAEGASYSSVRQKVGEHVEDVLNALAAEGISPRWVQIGNETNDGLLWDFGKASVNPRQYAGIINAGYNAVKKVCPEAKVIVHVSNGFDQSLFDWNLGELKRYSAQYDIIGMSLYPDNEGDAADVVAKTMANIMHISKSFGKPVMIVETGLKVTSTTADHAKAKSFMADILDRAKNDTDNACLGVFYWEPEAYSGWQHYSMGASTMSSKTIRFTPVMEAFKEMGEALSISQPTASPINKGVYTLDGRKLTDAHEAVPGSVVIVDGKRQLAPSR